MIKVAAAIIIRDSQVLLSKRPLDKHQGGKWEFPGGKIALNESPQQALVRECQEELGITLLAFEPYKIIEFDYGDKSVQLNFWKSDLFEGKPVGNEGQEVRWFEISEIEKLEFPAANQPIVDQLISSFSVGAL